MRGQLVCYRHGGKAPNSIAFAKRRQALDAVKSHVSRIVAYDGDDVTSPEEGLLMEVKWSGQVAIAYGEACEALIADEALTTKSAGAGMQLHALIRGPLACALQRGCTCPNRAQLCRSQGLPLKPQLSCHRTATVHELMHLLVCHDFHRVSGRSALPRGRSRSVADTAA
jgi:hypothetical protein